jgi:hypothetical protein
MLKHKSTTDRQRMKKTRKVPAGPKAQPKGGRYNVSSRKQPKPTGLAPTDPKYGIKNTSSGNTASLGRKVARLLGTSKFRTPSNQSALTRKTVKGQVK